MGHNAEATPAHLPLLSTPIQSTHTLTTQAPPDIHCNALLRPHSMASVEGQLSHSHTFQIIWAAEQVGSQAGYPPLAGFVNPPSSPPTQQIGSQPTYPQVEDSLLKRHTRMQHRKSQPASSFSLCGTHPVPILFLRCFYICEHFGAVTLIGPFRGFHSDMPLASGRVTGSQQRSAPYQRPLSNTRPLHRQNSVGTCCVHSVAQ